MNTERSQSRSEREAPPRPLPPAGKLRSFFGPICICICRYSTKINFYSTQSQSDEGDLSWVAVLCAMGNDDAAAARHRAANAATSGPPPGVSAEEWGSLSKSEQKRRLKQTEKEMKAAKKKAAKSNVQVAKSKAVVDEGELDPTTYFKNRLAKVKALQACVLSHRSQRELVIPAAKFS